MSTSSAASVVNDEEVILVVDSVEATLADGDPTPTKLTITNRFLHLANVSDGGTWQIFYSAVTDFSLEADLTIYPEPRVVVNFDVNKEDRCVASELRKWVIDAHKGIESPGISHIIPVDEEGKPDYDNYHEPCYSMFTFYPSESEECSVETIYGAISEAISNFSGPARTEKAETETGEEEDAKDEDKDDEKGAKDAKNEDKDDDEED